MISTIFLRISFRKFHSWKREDPKAICHRQNQTHREHAAKTRSASSKISTFRCKVRDCTRTPSYSFTTLVRSSSINDTGIEANFSETLASFVVTISRNVATAASMGNDPASHYARAFTSFGNKRWGTDTVPWL